MIRILRIPLPLRREPGLADALEIRRLVRQARVMLEGLDELRALYPLRTRTVRETMILNAQEDAMRIAVRKLDRMVRRYHGGPLAMALQNHCKVPPAIAARLERAYA